MPVNKPLDEIISRSIAKEIGSKAKSPFENAYKAALAMPDVSYVQGFLAFAGQPFQPIEHSWLEQPDRIVDPTLPHLGRAATDLHYFPAQSLTVKRLKAVVEEAREDYPDDDPLPIYGPEPYAYYGDLMLGGKDYQKAFEQAAAKCRELNQPRLNDRGSSNGHGR